MTSVWCGGSGCLDRGEQLAGTERLAHERVGTARSEAVVEGVRPAHDNDPDAWGGDPKSTGDGMTRLIGQIKAPEDGNYTVTTESTQAGQRISPALTFGFGC